MSVYTFETNNLEFSWGNDRSVTIRSKGVHLVQKGINILSNKGFDIYMFKTSPVGVKINDFDEQEISVLNNVVASFVPVEKGHLRVEVFEGLKYYKAASRYKLLVSKDVADKKIEVLSRDYKNITEKMPEFIKELAQMEEKALECHISEPLVASTGLMVYSTRDMNWFIYETDQKVEALPEYIHECYKGRIGLDSNTYFKRGTQQDCIGYVLQNQVDLYGFSISDLLRKRNDKEVLLTTIRQIELILKISEDNKWKDPKDDNLEVNPSAQLDKYRANLT